MVSKINEDLVIQLMVIIVAGGELLNNTTFYRDPIEELMYKNVRYTGI